MSYPPSSGPPGGYPPGPPPPGGPYPPGPPSGGGYPGGPPPGGGYPGGGHPGGPPQGGGHPGGGYPQGSSGPPPKASRTGLIVGLAVGVLVVLAIVAVGVVVATRGPSSISEDEAAASLEEIIDQADFDDTDAELRDCPLGELRDYEVALEDVVDDVPRLRDRSQGATEDLQDGDPGVACIASEDQDEVSGAGLYTYASATRSGDHARVLEDLFDGDDVTVEDPEGYRGGEIYAYCVDPDSDSEADPGCGADWVGEEISVGLYLEGLDADAEVSADVLRDLISDMVDALAVAEPDFE